jgi:hypothetical protein
VAAAEQLGPVGGAVRGARLGHSFGGLLTQILAGRGLTRVSVAIDPAPFRGVLPLPISSLKSAFPVRRGAVRDLRRARLGRALTIDSGWRAVADTALAFVRRFTGKR